MDDGGTGTARPLGHGPRPRPPAAGRGGSRDLRHAHGTAHETPRSDGVGHSVHGMAVFIWHIQHDNMYNNNIHVHVHVKCISHVAHTDTTYHYQCGTWMDGEDSSSPWVHGLDLAEGFACLIGAMLAYTLGATPLRACASKSRMALRHLPWVRRSSTVSDRSSGRSLPSSARTMTSFWVSSRRLKMA